MGDEKLENQLKEYRDLAEQNPNVDAAALMINALQKHQENLLPAKVKRWAYLISLSVPPFGLVFALKFYLSHKDDGVQSAWICIALTILSIALFWVSLNTMLSGSGIDAGQIQQIDPQQIQQLLQ